MIKILVSKIAEFNGHRDAIFSLLASDDRKSLFTGASDGMIVEWDCVNPGDGRLLVKVPSPVYSLLVEGKEGIYAGTSTGNLHYISLKESAEKRNVEAHTAGIFHLLRLPGNGIVSAAGDGRVRFWSKELDLENSLDLSDKSARVMALHPQLPLLAVGYSDHLIRMIDSEKRTLIQTIEGHTNSVFSLAWSPDGRYLLSGGRDATLRIWDVTKDFMLVKSIPAHWYHINDIAFSPDARLFATCSMDKSIKIWDAGSFALLKVIDLERNAAHKHSVNKILWLSPEKLASCSDDRTAMIFSVIVD